MNSDTSKMRFGSLFSGIGGMDLGLERAGMECAWQVELDLFCQRVLQKHWPNVPKYRDVQICGGHNLERVDLIAGGFPCQDISFAGNGEGIDGSRSGLWSEMFRIICELRPDYVLVENVAALLARGMGRVLGDLASVGYDAEWSRVSACSMGAPQMRRRVFVLAYSTSLGWERMDQHSRRMSEIDRSNTGTWNGKRLVEPGIQRMAYGISNIVERLAGAGNAVVPQVAEWIGRRILEAAAERRRYA